MLSTIVLLLAASCSMISDDPNVPEAAPKPREARQTQDGVKLVGIWQIEKIESGEFRLAGDAMKDKFWVFTGSEVLNAAATPPLIGTYTIDTSTSPKRLVIQARNGALAERTVTSFTSWMVRLFAFAGSWRREHPAIIRRSSPPSRPRGLLFLNTVE